MCSEATNDLILNDINNDICGQKALAFYKFKFEKKSNVCVSTSATFRKARKAATNRLGLDILGEEGNKS